MTSFVHMILILVSSLVSSAQWIDQNKNNRDTRIVYRYGFFLRPYWYISHTSEQNVLERLTLNM